MDQGQASHTRGTALAKSHSLAKAISGITFYKDTSAVHLPMRTDTSQPCLDIEHDSSQLVRQGKESLHRAETGLQHTSLPHFYIMST